MTIHAWTIISRHIHCVVDNKIMDNGMTITDTKINVMGNKMKVKDKNMTVMYEMTKIFFHCVTLTVVIYWIRRITL